MRVQTGPNKKSAGEAHVNTGEVLVLMINELDHERVARTVQRAAEHCAATAHGLVVELIDPGLDVSELREPFTRVLFSNPRPLSLSVVVHPHQLAALRDISLELAHAGKILGDFVDRHAAETHALREARLVLVELAAMEASASSVRSVKSTKANARI